MRLLLDTHTLIWSADDPSKVSPVATASLLDPSNQLFLSAATIWELAIKFGQGKITLSMPYRDWMLKAINDLGLRILPITVAYADHQSTLPPHHKDPFDRLLIAQAIVERIPVVGTDLIFDAYGVQRIW